jgi:hypothetical protein
MLLLETHLLSIIKQRRGHKPFSVIVQNDSPYPVLSAQQLSGSQWKAISASVFASLPFHDPLPMPETVVKRHHIDQIFRHPLESNWGNKLNSIAPGIYIRA